MATLEGKTIASTYKDLLQVSNSNSGIDGTKIAVSDGEGTASPLELSSSAVNISSGFELGGSEVTASATELNVMDGSATTQATVTLAGTDGVVISDGGTMKQALVSDFDTYGISTSQTLTNKSIDADNNTITNIDASELGVTAGTVTASKAVVVDASKDIDWKGGRILNEQGRTNHVANTMPAPYYRFDGSNDYVNFSHNANFDFGTGDFSLYIRVYLPASSTAGYHLISKKVALNSSNAGFGISTHTGGIVRVVLADGGVGWSPYKALNSITQTQQGWNDIIFVRSGDDGYIYLNGIEDATDTGYNSGNSINTTNPMMVARDGSTSYGEISTGNVKIFNHALTATEVKELSSGASVPFKYKGANQTELTSGTLTIGKKYRINNWITNDDFTNIGGTNEDGNEFVATGTTPTTWTNSSTVVPIGAVAEYDGSGASEEHWFDTSGNDLHGDVTGATLNNQGDGGATKSITLTPRALPSTANASEGQIVYDSSANKLKVYNGSAWETITSS